MLWLVVSLYLQTANFLKCSPLSTDTAGLSVCPPVALQSGVGRLCGLLELWGQVPAGVLALTEWLLGEEESSEEAASDEFSSLVRAFKMSQGAAHLQTVFSFILPYQPCRKECAFVHV